MGNPQDEWQTCGMNARGTDFAACYRRDQQEIDDEIAGVRVSSLVLQYTELTSL